MGVNGKPKMWNISKTADRRGKRMKIWDTGSYSAYMLGTFNARFLVFSFRSFGALCKLSDSTSPTIFIRSYPNFWKTFTLLGNLAKFYKIYGTLKF